MPIETDDALCKMTDTTNTPKGGYLNPTRGSPLWGCQALTDYILSHVCVMKGDLLKHQSLQTLLHGSSIELLLRHSRNSDPGNIRLAILAT